MGQCDVIDKQNRKRIDSQSISTSNEDSQSDTFIKRQIKNNPFALFSGIVPGTKWCGTGDIATSYSDLGE